MSDDDEPPRTVKDLSDSDHDELDTELKDLLQGLLTRSQENFSRMRVQGAAPEIQLLFGEVAILAQIMNETQRRIERMWHLIESLNPKKEIKNENLH